MMKERSNNIDLNSIESRKALTKMVMRLFALWKIPATTQAILLNRSLSTIYRYRKDGCCADDEVLDHIGVFLGIHKNLRILYPHNQELVYEWVHMTNRAFGDRRPIDLMRQWLGGMIDVRSYLDNYVSM